MRKLLAILTVMIALPLADLEAIAPRAGKAKPPKTVSKAWYGMASWYGDHWRGRMTACGRLFDPDQPTAAHPSLPCGTWLRVTNVRTGHYTFAKVTDRGPYEEGREIDVSERVAKRIDLKKYGVEQVKLEIVRPAKETD
jgi:rare lipoprotein A